RSSCLCLIMKFDATSPCSIILLFRTRSSMDRATDFELDGKVEHPFHGGKLRPSSRWGKPELVHYEHKIHPFHPNCTGVAPEITINSNGLATRFQIKAISPYSLQTKYLLSVFVINEQLTLNQLGDCPPIIERYIASIVYINSIPIAPKLHPKRAKSMGRRFDNQ
ncbi:MAG: hypothetical protein MUO88_11125, partial [Desulfobacterales bacterium]|nr:hypothetical protein [Desulfobacterales bacterium]